VLARPFRRRVQALLALPLMVLGAVAVLPGEASAAKWYCNPRCDYKDPSSYPPAGPCADDAVTIYTLTHSGRTLQLRYSNNCETVWGRLYGGQKNDIVILERDGNPNTVDWEYFPPANEWTPMLDDHNHTIRACLQWDWASNTRVGCTGAY